MKGNTEAVAEGLEISDVRFVMNICHANMECLGSKARDVNLGTSGQEFQQAEGVLATRQADEDFVVLVDELVLTQRFVKSLPESFFEIHRYVCCDSVATYSYFMNTR